MEDHDLLRAVTTAGATRRTARLGPGDRLGVDDGAFLSLLLPLEGGGQVGDDRTSSPLGAGDTALVHGVDDVAFLASTETSLLLVGFRVDDQVSRRLIELLPAVVTLPFREECVQTQQFVSTLGDQRQVVDDHLMDATLTCLMGEWFSRTEAPSRHQVDALADHVVGRVLRAVHDDPARPWTLAGLAHEGRTSRTTLSKRFSDLLGQPPMTYVATWRVAVAADLLRSTDLSIAAIAHRVGYADAFGFSAAFKRIHGRPPSDYRSHPRPLT